MKRVFKIAILAVLAFASLESASADNILESKDGNAQAKTVTQNEQQDPTVPSPEEREIYEKLEKMVFDPNIEVEKETVLKKTENVVIVYLIGFTERETKKRLGDAIVVQYKNPEQERYYLKVKNEGNNPNPADYPTEEYYLIPITAEEIKVDAIKNNWLASLGEERCARIETSRYCFKQETYPDTITRIQGSVTFLKNENFNFANGGWIVPITPSDRCGLTKEFYVSVEEAKLILNCISENY